MKINIGIFDRFIRLLIATAIVIFHSSVTVAGVWATVTVVLAFYLIGTVIIGVCPLYRILHLNTDENQRHSAH